MPSGIAVKAVFSIVSYGKAGKPATARGSGRFSGAQLGGVMQRNLGVCVLAASRSQVQSTAKRLILRISLGAWRQLAMLMILCLLLAFRGAPPPTPAHPSPPAHSHPPPHPPP